MEHERKRRLVYWSVLTWSFMGISVGYTLLIYSLTVLVACAGGMRYDAAPFVLVLVGPAIFSAPWIATAICRRLGLSLEGHAG